MPQPITQPDGPNRTDQPVARHAMATPATRQDDLAMALPPWDLLPPAEFVRRRPAGG
jgi:hypothetical protein